MSLRSIIFGCKKDPERDRLLGERVHRREEVSRRIEEEAVRQRQDTQAIESGSRVLANMAGMMQIVGQGSEKHTR